jgi:large subunit ribosomal protein L32
MAVPFRRTSKTKKNMRRTHYKITPNELTTCSNCGEAIKPHRVCPKCGYYKGKNVVKEDKKEKTEE